MSNNSVALSFCNRIQENKKRQGGLLLGSLLMAGIFFAMIMQFFVGEPASYQRLRILLYAVFLTALFFLFSTSTTRLAWTLLHKVFTFVIFFATIALCLFAFLEDTFYIRDLIELILPFGVLILSSSIRITDKMYSAFIFIYSTIALSLALYFVFYYSGDIVVTHPSVFPAKNQVGMGLSAVSIMNIYIAFADNELYKKSRWKFVHGILGFGTLGLLLYIQNRSGFTSGVIVSGLIVFYYLLQHSNKLKSWFVLIILIVGGMLGLPYVEGDIKKVYRIEQGQRIDPDMVLSNRLGILKDAMSSIIQNPIMGNIEYRRDVVPIPHVYFIYKIAKYGLLCSLPWLVIYFLLWYMCAKSIVLSFRQRNYLRLSYCMLLGSLLTSMVEYSPPFGPGTTQVLMWFVIGKEIGYTMCLPKTNVVR